MRQRMLNLPRANLAGDWTRRSPMTPKQAYRMGFRHITDLAQMNRIADLYLEGEIDEKVFRLIEAWREGAMAATAMLDMPNRTVH